VGRGKSGTAALLVVGAGSPVATVADITAAAGVAMGGGGAAAAAAALGAVAAGAAVFVLVLWPTLLLRPTMRLLSLSTVLLT
jgi:hypothetical protein